MSEYIVDGKWIDDFISNIEELIGVEIWYDSGSNPIPPLKEIVRCRDCRHHDGGMCYLPDGNGDYARREVGACDFCSSGERRDA